MARTKAVSYALGIYGIFRAILDHRHSCAHRGAVRECIKAYQRAKYGTTQMLGNYSLAGVLRYLVYAHKICMYLAKQSLQNSPTAYLM